MKNYKISASTESSGTKKLKRSVGPDLSSIPSKSRAVEKYPAVHPAGMAGASITGIQHLRDTPSKIFSFIGVNLCPQRTWLHRHCFEWQ